MKYQDKSRLQHALPTPFYDNFPKQSFLPLATYFSRNRSKFSPHEEFFRLPWKITFPHISIIYLHQFVMITIARWLERENMKISLVQYRRKLKTYNKKVSPKKAIWGSGKCSHFPGTPMMIWIFNFLWILAQKGPEILHEQHQTPPGKLPSLCDKRKLEMAVDALIG